MLTNCDEVRIRYGANLVKQVGPDQERFSHLPHAPVVIDHRHFSADEMGLWGMSWDDCHVTGFVQGRSAATRRYVADPLPTTLEAAPDALTLDAQARDEVRVIVRALDQAGNRLPFLAGSVRIEVDGPARLIGPAHAPLQGGTTGFWLRATGEPGEVRLRLSTDRFAPVTLMLSAE